MMAQRLNYKVDENQEIYTVGFVLTLSGFLPVYPTSNALSRPQILVECGATSQIHNFVAGGLMVCVLLAIGPLFYWLPMVDLISSF
jgi:MFS superfamily sulfate permease-like transporter